MEQWMEKLQVLLSDPESMQNLSELVSMLGAANDNPSADGTPEASSTDGDEPSGDDAGDQPAFDFSKLLMLGSVFSSMQGDDNTALLLALKPHLREARAKRVDRAVKLLRVYQAVTVLKENGMLSDLLDQF